MTMKTSNIHTANWRSLAACSVLLIAAGCATVPEAPEPAATISVQEDVGFSITETVPVDGNQPPAGSSATRRTSIACPVNVMSCCSNGNTFPLATPIW